MILLIHSLIIHCLKEVLLVQFLDFSIYILLHYVRNGIYISNYQKINSNSLIIILKFIS